MAKISSSLPTWGTRRYNPLRGQAFSSRTWGYEGADCCGAGDGVGQHVVVGGIDEDTSGGGDGAVQEAVVRDVRSLVGQPHGNEGVEEGDLGQLHVEGGQVAAHKSGRPDPDDVLVQGGEGAQVDVFLNMRHAAMKVVAVVVQAMVLVVTIIFFFFK